MKFHIILKKEPNGWYTVIVPSLPGCVTYWETIEQAHDMAQEAIGTYLEVQQEMDQDIQDDSSSVFDTIFVKPKSLLPKYRYNEQCTS